MSYRIYREFSPRSGKVWVGWIFEKGGNRKKQSLKAWYKQHPKTDDERRQKQEVELIAKEKIHALNLEFYRGALDVGEIYLGKEDFFAFAFSYVENEHQRKVKDVRKHIGVLKKLKTYSKKDRLLCFEVTKQFLEQFPRFLESDLNGQSVRSYFVRLRQILDVAVERGYFKSNPAAHIKVKNRDFRPRDILTVDEVKLLIQTPLANEEVKRANLLSQFTGLRFVDVKNLRGENIRGSVIQIIQQKTRVALEIPIDDKIRALIGTHVAPKEKVFKLPSYTASLKWLKRWVADAGIEKHVTWHTARRSAATTLISNGIPITTVSRVLGHTSITNTQIYVKTSEDLKRKAIESLTSLFTSQN